MMPRKAIDFTGTRKGRLTISHRVEDWFTGGVSRPVWAVRCDCGTEKEMTSSQLQGNTISCGCHRKEMVAERLTTHGMAGKGDRRSRVYRIWAGMKSRCGNPNAINYDRYGGRGIRVCDGWQEFISFYAVMGDPPSSKHTLDRIDNAKGYEPGNCRWATYEEQAANQFHSPEKGRKAFDLAGERFGRLTAIERAGSRGRSPLWRMRCDCGNEHNVTTQLLRRGTVQSCGCLRSETARAHMTAFRRA